MVLPEEFRKSRFADVSGTFVAILAASVAVHFGLVVFLLTRPHPPEEGRAVPEVQARLATLIVRHPEVTREAPARQRPRTTEAEERWDKPTTGALAGGGVGTGAGGRATTQARERGGAEPPLAEGLRRTRDRLAAEVRSQGVLRLITSGSAAAGQQQAEELLGSREPTGELNAVLAGVGELRSSGMPTGGQQVRGGRATEAGTIDTIVGELGTATSANVQRGGTLVVEPVTPLTKEGEVTTLAGRDPEQVSRVVNRHNDAIEYCYQKELRRNPTLKGKLVVRFTITPQGKVSNVTIISSSLNNPELETCIVRRIQRWDDFGAVDPSLGDATFRQVYTFGF